MKPVENAVSDSVRIAKKSAFSADLLINEFNRQMDVSMVMINVDSFEEMIRHLREGGSADVASQLSGTRELLTKWARKPDKTIILENLSNKERRQIADIRLWVMKETRGIDFILKDILKIPEVHWGAVTAELLK
ncbi:MAG: hypothetical protein HOO67_01715 [Candidatus Peribacteraceae bacterium]|nr:hypothetical protein [Candidatus Peribacteraceae bacterium]